MNANTVHGSPWGSVSSKVPDGYPASEVSNRPPLMPDECPAASYKVEVQRHSWYLTVEASLIHRMPDGSLQASRMPFENDLRVTVDEPCWLFRLFGDTIERRVARAKARVSRAAEQEIAKRKRLDAAFKAVT